MERPGQLRRTGQARRKARSEPVGKVRASVAALERADVCGLEHLPEGDLEVARQFTAGFRFAIEQVPKGRLNPSNVICLFQFSLRIQHKGPTTFHYHAASREALAISGWYRTGKGNEGPEHRRRRGPCSHFALVARDDACGKSHAAHQGRLFKMGA